MAHDETLEIVAALEASRNEVNSAVTNIADTQASTKPQPDRWSIVECLEHLANVEDRILSRLQSADRVEAPVIDKEREQKLVTDVRDRTNRVQAPPAIQPTGQFTSIQGALDHFNASRAQTIAFARQHGAELHSMQVNHPRFGLVSGAEFLRLAAGHCLRHVDQIREISGANHNVDGETSSHHR